MLIAILFEDAIILGAENDTILYTSDAKSPFSLPFCVLERTVRFVNNSIYYICAYSSILPCTIILIKNLLFLESSLFTSNITATNSKKFGL